MNYLTQTEQKVYDLTNGRKIGSLGITQKSQVAKTIIEIFEKRTGQTSKVTEDLLVNDFYKFPFLTAEELRFIVDLACDGHFQKKDQFLLLTAANFVQWCRAYQNDFRSPTLKKTAQYEHQEGNHAPPPSDDTLKGWIIEIIRAHVKAYKAGTGYYESGCSALWDYAVQFGFVGMNKESKLVLVGQVGKDPTALKNAAWSRLIVQLSKSDVQINSGLNFLVKL
jgi:hypothetical protein